MSVPKVSVLMPAYNEHSNIRRALEDVSSTLDEIGVSYEIIVIDDGSTDGTGKEVLNYAKVNERVRLVSNGVNQGKGAALKRGTIASKGDFIILMDSDCEISPKDLRLYISALERYEIAIGSKWVAGSRVDAPIMRKILSRCFYLLARLLVGIKVSDTQAGLKAFRRGVLRRIVEAQLVKRYAFDVELLAIASLLKARIVELPVSIELGSGFSFRSVKQMFWDLLGITHRLRIIKWYQRKLQSASFKD